MDTSEAIRARLRVLMSKAVCPNCSHVRTRGGNLRCRLTSKVVGERETCAVFEWCGVFFNERYEEADLMEKLAK